MTDFKNILKPIIPLRVTAFIMQLFSIALSLAQPVLIGRLLDVINQVGHGTEFNTVTQLTIILIVVSLLDFVVYYLKDYLFSKALYTGINLMREHVLSLALNQPASVLERGHVGDMLNKILNDSELYAKYMIYQIPDTVIVFIRLVAIYTICITMSLPLTGVLAGVFIVYLSIYLLINKKIRPLINNELARYSDVMNQAQEAMDGFETIKINVEEDYFIARFGKSLKTYLKSKLRVQRFNSLDNALLNFFYAIIPILILGVGAYFIVSKQITLGVLLIFYSFNHWIIEPVYTLAGLNRIRQQAVVAFPRLQTFMKETSSEALGVEKSPIQSIKTIELTNVGFAYDESKVIIENLSLKLQTGSRLAITGESGSGKSTLAMLLLGIIKPDHGELLVNGQALKNIEAKSYLNQCAYMPQEIFLFSESVQENITFGRENPNFPSEMLRKLKLEDVLTRQVKDVRELSGGEKQRLGIARSMYRMPSLIIYDEPTASLDEGMERQIIQAIDDFLALNPCIFIAITHRKSILEICNQQLHLDGNSRIELIDLIT